VELQKGVKRFIANVRDVGEMRHDGIKGRIIHSHSCPPVSKLILAIIWFSDVVGKEICAAFLTLKRRGGIGTAGHR
jgi:hypothetical protein